MPSIGNASLLEIVFTIMAVIGFVFALLNVWNRAGDIAWLKARRLNGARILVARAFLRAECFATVKLLTCIVIGIVSMQVPEPQRQPFQILTIVASAGILAIVSLIILDSILRWRDRRLLIAMIEASVLAVHEHSHGHKSE